MPNQDYERTRAQVLRRTVAALLLPATAIAAGLWMSPLRLIADAPPLVSPPPGSSAGVSRATAPHDQKDSSTQPVATPARSGSGTGGRIAPEDLPPVFHKPVLTSLDDAKAVEKQVRALLPRLSRAVVAVEVGEASGSGVVVSEEGLVLTAAHVGEEANRDVRFTFPDGNTARGKTLGMNHALDAGLMKITQQGPWPHVEMGDLERAPVGEWVLALGHPGGFDPERSLVVRLGRVIRWRPEILQTDCPITAGDSGGPLFDMRGRVIGIHSRISDSTAENFHVPITSFQSSWDRLMKGDVWGDGKAPRPWFGVRGVDHPHGCKLVSVEEEGPAFKAGLQTGDIIRKLNAHAVPDYGTLKRLVAEAKPGEELKVQLERDQHEVLIVVKIETRPRRR